LIFDKHGTFYFLKEQGYQTGVSKQGFPTMGFQTGVSNHGFPNRGFQPWVSKQGFPTMGFQTGVSTPASNPASNPASTQLSGQESGHGVPNQVSTHGNRDSRRPLSTMFQLETHRISTGYQHPSKKIKIQNWGQKNRKKYLKPLSYSLKNFW